MNKITCDDVVAFVRDARMKASMKQRDWGYWHSCYMNEYARKIADGCDMYQVLECAQTMELVELLGALCFHDIPKHILDTHYRDIQLSHKDHIQYLDNKGDRLVWACANSYYKTPENEKYNIRYRNFMRDGFKCKGGVVPMTRDLERLVYSWHLCAYKLAGAQIIQPSETMEALDRILDHRWIKQRELYKAIKDALK